ncbi:MAG: arylesterase [Acidobacteria bacterium]|nr:arylesterase [Acidobacteriota bacterium]
MTRSCTAVLLGLVLVGCSGREATSPASDASATEPVGGPSAGTPARDDDRAGQPRIVFLGDSLTAGYGLDLADAVPSRIQRRLETEGYAYQVVNAGVSGDTSAGGRSRLEWALDAEGGRPEVLVVELGANDGLRGLPVSQLRENLEAIITTARGRGIDVILTGMEAPPNYGAAYTQEFRQVYRDLAEAHDVVFVPFYLEGVAGIPSLNIQDGIHPNADGTRIIEETIWRALEPVLEKQDR